MTLEGVYILNTFSFLVHGVLVMFMAAGFAMLEAGLVRTKNVATICLKNIALYSLAGVMFWVCGYNLMYLGVDGDLAGIPLPWGGDNTAALAGDFSAGYSAESDWFFQMVFVATTASIISGTVAERIRLWPFLLFVAVLAGILYPVQAVGILSVGAFMFAASFLVWTAIDRTIGLRVSEDGEYEGLDKTELGLEAYPEFGHGSQKI